jgi:hypothetical protein
MNWRAASRLVALVAVVAVSACGGGTTDPPITAGAQATAGAAPTVDRLEGVWLDSEGDLWVLFTNRGRFAADPVRGYLYNTPYGAGTYKIEGNTISFLFANTEVCKKGDASAWTANLPEPDELVVEVTDDGTHCHWGLGDHKLTRVGDS